MSKYGPWPDLHPETNDRNRLVEWQEAVGGLHLRVVPVAQRSLAPSPAEVDREEIRRELSRSMGVDDLSRRLGSTTSRPVAPEITPIDRLAILSSTYKEAFSDVPAWKFGEKWRSESAVLIDAETAVGQERSFREAERNRLQAELDAEWDRLTELRVELDRKVDVTAERVHLERSETQAAEQHRLDRGWDQLLQNQPDAIKRSLKDRVRPQEVNLEIIGIEGKTVTAITTIGTVEKVVPERCPSVTPGGKPTTKKRTKTERNAAHLDLLAGITLNAALTVFATAPGTESAVIAVVTDGGPVAVLTLTELSRDRYRPGAKMSKDALTELARAGSFTRNLRGRTNQVVPIDGESIQRISPLVAASLGSEPRS